MKLKITQKTNNQSIIIKIKKAYAFLQRTYATIFINLFFNTKRETRLVSLRASYHKFVL